MRDEARGQRISERMDGLDITVEALAERCGASSQVVYKWRNGHTLPSGRVIQLCGILQCSADFLLLGVEGPQESQLHGVISQMPDEHRDRLLLFLKSVYNKNVTS